mgnify:CR=1 FL=1
MAHQNQKRIARETENVETRLQEGFWVCKNTIHFKAIQRVLFFTISRNSLKTTKLKGLSEFHICAKLIEWHLARYRHRARSQKIEYRYNWQNAFLIEREKIGSISHLGNIPERIMELITQISASIIAIKPNRSFTPQIGNNKNKDIPMAINRLWKTIQNNKSRKKPQRIARTPNSNLRAATLLPPK